MTVEHVAQFIEIMVTFKIKSTNQYSLIFNIIRSNIFQFCTKVATPLKRYIIIDGEIAWGPLMYNFVSRHDKGFLKYTLNK